MEKTMTVKEIADYFAKIAKVTPKAPVYISSDSEGNSYGTIEAPNTKNFSSIAVCLTPDQKNVKTVVIYPWKEGLTDEDVGLIEKDE